MSTIEPLHSLQAHHLRIIEDSAISAEVAAARGYVSATQRGQLEAYGFRGDQLNPPGLLIPIYNTRGEVGLAQFRPDQPRRNADGKPIKYETPRGKKLCIDVPPRVLPDLSDATVPLWITEGARKADSAVSAGLSCVALLGVWSFKRDGAPLEDWSDIALDGRSVYVAYDSDVMTKNAVAQALAALRTFLASRGALVYFVHLPEGENGEKVGLDDYLAGGHSVEELKGLAVEATPTDDEVVAELASMSAFDRDRAVKPRAKEMGVSVKTLREQVAVRQRQCDGRVEGARQIVPDDPEPWDEPVDGNLLVQATAEQLQRFLVLQDDDLFAVIAIWVLMAHSFRSFVHSPYLWFRSPTPGCGKTVAQESLRRLMPRAVKAEGVTAAAVYRLIELHQPTLIIDEIDTFLHSEDLRGVLDSGWERGGQVIRCQGDDHDPRGFATWCPKVLGGLNKIHATVADRSILVPMQRKLSTEKRDGLHYRDDQGFNELKRRAARWAADHAEALATAEPDMGVLQNRSADVWRPLYAIAQMAGGPWPEILRAYAESIADRAPEDTRTLLLADLRGRMGDAPFHLTEDLLKHLVDIEERPWAEISNGRPISGHKLAKLLDPFGIAPRQSTGPGRHRGYLRADFVEAWSRYLGVEEEGGPE